MFVVWSLINVVESKAATFNQFEFEYWGEEALKRTCKYNMQDLLWKSLSLKFDIVKQISSAWD